eukprot:15435816-Alexandrium_andersonii.AAC.1
MKAGLEGVRGRETAYLQPQSAILQSAQSLAIGVREAGHLTWQPCLPSIPFTPSATRCLCQDALLAIRHGPSIHRATQ